MLGPIFKFVGQDCCHTVSSSAFQNEMKQREFQIPTDIGKKKRNIREKKWVMPSIQTFRSLMHRGAYVKVGNDVD